MSLALNRVRRSIQTAVALASLATLTRQSSVMLPGFVQEAWASMSLGPRRLRARRFCTSPGATAAPPTTARASSHVETGTASPQLQVYGRRDEGLEATPLFTVSTWLTAARTHRGRRPAPSTCTRADNSSMSATGAAPAGRRNEIAVFRINEETGEPLLVPNADTHGFTPRTFSLDPLGPPARRRQPELSRQPRSVPHRQRRHPGLRRAPRGRRRSQAAVVDGHRRAPLTGTTA